MPFEGACGVLMIDYPEKEGYTAEDLVAIVAILRDPENGCPWDKVQTHASIRMNFLEEAYEAVDAIDLDDPHLLCEELGDVLMQVALHAQMEDEQGHFDWNSVCDGVCRKLIGRHPHIFTENSDGAGIKDWDTLKNKEKGRMTCSEDLVSVPNAMPALMRATKLQKRAARYGVLLPRQDAAKTAIEAVEILQGEMPSAELAEQALGALLCAAVTLGRAAGLDPEQALQKANERFIRAAKAQTEP